MKIPDYPRHEKIPDCEHRQIGGLRIYRKQFLDSSKTEDVLECLYEDGNGNLFWAPVPIVLGPRPSWG